MHIRKFRRTVMSLAFGLVAASCGGSDDPVAESETVTGSSETAIDEVSAEAEVETTLTEADDAVTDLEIITLEAVDTEVNQVTSSALGGIRFERPADTVLLVVDDVVLLAQEVGDPEQITAYLTLTSQLYAGGRVDSIEGYLEVVELTHNVTPTGTALMVGDIELTGYEIEGSEILQVFASSRFPAPVLAGGGPGLFTLSFMAETPSGVVDVGVSGPTREKALAMLPALGTMLASLQFTGPGLDPQLPHGEVIEPSAGGSPPPPADAVDDALAPPLGPPFSSVEPGRYEVLNFGLPISLEFGEDWFIQPNFPGVVVLTGPASVGPNDRDLVFMNSITELIPLAGGPLVAGDAIPIVDIEDFLASPPAMMRVSEVERTVLEAENGSTTRVISFTVEIVGDHACSPTDPCELGFVTSYGLVKPLRPTDAHRVWWFPEHPHGPAAVIMAAGVDSDWVSLAEEVMATLELSR